MNHPDLERRNFVVGGVYGLYSGDLACPSLPALIRRFSSKLVQISLHSPQM
jgi:hypothetical protein